MGTERVFSIDFSQLDLTVRKIENMTGDQDGASSGILTDLIAEALDEASLMCSVKAEYRIFNGVTFNPAGKTVSIDSTSFDISKIVYSQIRKSTAIAIFLCTAGQEIGTASGAAMKEGDLLKGYLFDIIGSEIVEAAADLMQNSLHKEMNASGLGITNRYSPGYCGWNVAEQHKLFSLMPGNRCGIALNESALMSPIKSVSGFIGIGGNVRFNPYTCSFCDMKECIYRSRRIKPAAAK
jgi:hypothetical protein